MGHDVALTSHQGWSARGALAWLEARYSPLSVIVQRALRVPVLPLDTVRLLLGLLSRRGARCGLFVGLP